MASPTSYSDANGRCRWTVPMDSTCGEVSSSCKPAGAERERRNARTRRSDASLLNARVSSPEHRAGAGWKRAFHALLLSAGARAREPPPARRVPPKPTACVGRREAPSAPPAPPASPPRAARRRSGSGRFGFGRT